MALAPALPRKRFTGRLKALRKQYFRALYKELSTRIFMLPQEIRDMIYEKIWGIEECWQLDYFGIDKALPPSCSWCKWSPPRSSPDAGSTALCPCSAHLPQLVQSRLVGKAMASEMLGTLRRMNHVGSNDRHDYNLEWGDMEYFATPDIFHLGMCVHSLFEKLHLRVHFGCLDGIENDRGLEALGVPGGFTTQLAGCVQSLGMLSDQGPRRITFVFEETGQTVPSNVTFLFRALCAVFHELKGHVFDMRVQYRPCWMSKWNLRASEWIIGPEKDPWTWDLATWNPNFTRTNFQYLPKSVSGDCSFHDPNGPVEICFLTKLPVWESIRRDLYYFQPDVPSRSSPEVFGGGDIYRLRV